MYILQNILGADMCICIIMYCTLLRHNTGTYYGIFQGLIYEYMHMYCILLRHSTGTYCRIFQGLIYVYMYMYMYCTLLRHGTGTYCRIYQGMIYMYVYMHIYCTVLRHSTCTCTCMYRLLKTHIFHKYWCTNSNGILQCTQVVGICQFYYLQTIFTLHVTYPSIGLKNEIN